VAICAGCDTVYPWAGFVIGLVAGLVFMIWTFLIEKLKIDDPLDAVAGIVTLKLNIILLVELFLVVMTI
jgi:ammonia channel protein AmtB